MRRSTASAAQRGCRTDGPFRAAVFISMAIVCIGVAGCASASYVKVRSTPASPLVERLQLASRRGPRVSERTMQVLRRYGLADRADDPERALDGLMNYVRDEPHPEGYYAMAELAHIAGRRRQRHDEAHALELYGASVAYAYLYLFDPSVGYLRNPYDPQFRGACDLYNGSLEESLRILTRNNALVAGASHRLEAAGGQWTVDIVSHATRWRAEDFEQFKFVSDYEVRGLPNHYRTYGLGVPLIGVRRAPNQQSPEEHYYPPGMSLPVTAFLSVVPAAATSNSEDRSKHRCVLELYDTLNTTDVAVAGRRVPLESDLTTPLAYFLDRADLDSLSLVGLLKPEELNSYTGLYMAQPFEPDKIPVLMIHGLYSSPMTWMEMFNDLRAQPELRKHYQFWFYLYPTGEPFWISAAQLRYDLHRMREELDPQHRAPALDHMVLVGHSMGGLLARMQIVSSGNRFWNLVTDQPFQLVKAETDVRDRLAQAFFFRPNPSVRRVITIGTPYRGSTASNSATQWLAQRLIRLPNMLLVRRQQLFKQNPGIFPRRSLLETTNSIEALAPSSPILPVLLEASPAPWVKVHNIVGVAQNSGLIQRVSFTERGDGVVSFESAHLDNVASELVVDADHMTVHRHPLAVLEVRRILHEHLAELRSFGRPAEPQMWSAGYQRPVQPTNPTGNRITAQLPRAAHARRLQQLPASSTASPSAPLFSPPAPPAATSSY